MPATREHEQQNETPRDAWGKDYLLYQLRSDFHDLCRIIGFSNAREEVAEILLSEIKGKR